MTTSTLPRLADQAVAARAGADLYRFRVTDRIPDAAFARNSDGSFTVTGIDFLKVGTFNGLSLVDGDLEAMVDRFAMLRDGGVFVPPFRLDHSWSILSVIGWIEELETYSRVDETDGVSKLFLRGDVRITGSVDYEPAVLVAAIKRGALRPRSSELGYYVTNQGTELPLVFYGCAFVDIPAVEGLAPVELSRTSLSVPHKITNLSTPEGSASMDPEQIARLVELRALESPTGDETSERDRLEQLAHDSETEIPDSVDSDDPGTVTAPSDATDAAAADEETPGVRDPEDDPAGDEEESEEEESGDQEEEGEEEPPADATGTELARLRQENANLRRENADRQITGFRSSGILTQAIEEDARVLLTHDDEDVRRRTGTLLAGIPARLELGKRHGRTALQTAGGTTTGTSPDAELIRLGMEPDEVGALWADLTPAERKLRQPEYDAWREDRAASR